MTRRFFIPALAVRFGGAILLGLIYQFYYGGGDTFNYWTHGSEWVWRAFLDNPVNGLRLLFKRGPTHIPELFEYSKNIWYYRDPASYFIVRLTFFFDLLTLHTYSSTALFFASLNFSGMWALFSAVQKRYPHNTTILGLVVLFFPSLVFWGSGILKDSVTLAAVGFLIWALLSWIEFKKRSWIELVIFTLGFLTIYSVKPYILFCIIPTVFIWLLIKNIKSIKNKALSFLVGPFLIFFFSLAAFLAVRQVGSENKKYTLGNLAERARITAYDIRYGWGARLQGDGGYDIGGLPDGTIQGMLKLAPSAINVSLFRPYIWEARNPLMLLAALESLVVLLLSLKVLFSGRVSKLSDPFLIFCLSFTITFAFAVGVSTFNFGSLMRYKIPMIPLFMIFLFATPPRK